MHETIKLKQVEFQHIINVQYQADYKTLLNKKQLCWNIEQKVLTYSGIFTFGDQTLRYFAPFP